MADDLKIKVNGRDVPVSASSDTPLLYVLMNELRLNDRRQVLKDILETSVPITPQDVVLIFCTVSGWKGGASVPAWKKSPCPGTRS